MNDGSAFPFVMLGLGLFGLRDLVEFGLQWVLFDVMWATVAGVAIGALVGCTMFLDSWSWRAAGLALFLFAVARPLSVLACRFGWT